MADYGATRPSSGPGSGRRSRRTSNRRAREAQAVAAPSGGDYGDRKKSEDAQAAIPLPKADLSTALAAAAASAPPTAGLGDPTSRPNEPVTAGLPTGPGPGPSALATGVNGNPDIEMVRALYRQFPTEAVRRVLERLDREVGPDRQLALMGPGAMMPRPHPGSPTGKMAGQLGRDTLPVGTSTAVQAAYQGLPEGGRSGRIAAREGMDPNR